MWTHQDEETQLRDTWTYVGRHRSHGQSITGLEYGTREDGRVSLVSVGEDRSLVEYNLLDSNQVSKCQWLRLASCWSSIFRWRYSYSVEGF